MKTLITVVLLAVSPVLFAQDQPTTSTSHSGAMPDDQAHKEMMQMMQKMNKEMMSGPMTGNADVDFATMMIPHHQGAVDMAKWQLKYGKDKKLREMAEQIVNSQEKEIQELRERLNELKSTAVTGGSKSNAETPQSSNAAHGTHH
jgi:uncharacterized protein (DUF305 family)